MGTPTRTAAELTAHLATSFGIDPGRPVGIVEEVTGDSLLYRQPTTAANLRPGASVSGPTLMQVADTVAWLLTLAQLPAGQDAVTQSLTIDFLRRPGLGDLVAAGELLKCGRRSVVVAVRISAGGDELMAHATVTYAPLPLPA